MREIEQAWAAGFFDGEGYVGLVRTANARSPRARRRIVISMAQTDRRVLDRFTAVVGIGKVYGPYGPRNKRHKEYFQYTAKGYENVFLVWHVLRKYLSHIKRTQFMEALDAYNEERSR